MTDDTLFQSIEALAELRELVREAHGVTKDLRQAIREAKQVQSTLPEAAAARIETAVEKGLSEYSAVLADSIEKATQAVFRRFDTIAAVCLGEDAKSVREGKLTLKELLEKRNRS
jgi:hypothetical protein